VPDSKGLEESNVENVAIAIAVGVVLYLGLGLFLWWFLNGYIDPSSIKDPADRASAKKDFLQALGLIMAGVAGAVGVFFTWRNLQQGQANLRLTQEGMRQTQEGTQESLRLTQEQLQLSREEHQLSRQGEITQRFTTAVELLGAVKGGGDKNLEQRLIIWFRMMVAPGFRAGRGLEPVDVVLLAQEALGCARPSGRARIGTTRYSPTATGRYGCARPSGRARIGTRKSTSRCAS
jgi:hypothetical protein